MADITCEDCGLEFQSSRDNAKYCRVCRLFRNLVFIEARTYDCWACGGEFAPLERNQKFCGDCNTVRSAHDAPGTCSFCKEKTEQLLHKEVKVCRKCATDPENRQLLIRALHKKKASRASE